MTINQAELQKLIGLPAGMGLRMVLLGSGQAKSGKVGLLKYEGINGKSLHATAREPLNRGAVMITFETQTMADLYERLGCPPSVGRPLSRGPLSFSPARERPATVF